MKRKILIYGYGWVGESVFRFCSCFNNVSIRVIDEKIDLHKQALYDERFIQPTKKEFLEFDYYLIAIFTPAKAEEVKQKLIAIGILEHKIKNITEQRFSDNMKSFVIEYFESFEEICKAWEKDDFYLSCFHKVLDDFISKYYKIKNNYALKDKREKYDALEKISVFSKIFETSTSKLGDISLNYPGFYVMASTYKKNDKDFYFIEKIDFDNIAKRRRNIKLIACLGNSALRVEYLPTNQTITSYMQEEIGEEYIVLNFGVSGSTIYEQLMLYNAIVYPLKPDIVISFFGGTELRCGVVACDVMVKTHKMVYVPNAWETTFKRSNQSKIDLYYEMGRIPQSSNSLITQKDILIATYERLNQLRNIVFAGGGAFYGFIQPILPCKNVWSQQEIQMRNKEKKYYDEVYPDYNRIFDMMKSFVKEISDWNLPYLYNLNDIIRECKEDIFTNYWIHCNALGNKMCAKKVVEILKQN
ncbi:hypothetical protein [Helicobacter valdiviensis]|uniref:hypothetical protein n=1 Tax=Helicobacter valdiviensis TaxID=1458358 RepID=UPI0015EB7CA6|nr:hypothetical protein [Helicobacter valdiviensis]